MIAILTNNIPHVLNYLKKEGTFKDYNFSRRKGLFTSDREFVIVNDAEQLEGVRLSDFRIIGVVDEKLVEAAKLRLSV